LGHGIAFKSHLRDHSSWRRFLVWPLFRIRSPMKNLPKGSSRPTGVRADIRDSHNSSHIHDSHYSCRGCLGRLRSLNCPTAATGTTAVRVRHLTEPPVDATAGSLQQRQTRHIRLPLISLGRARPPLPSARKSLPTDSPPFKHVRNVGRAVSLPNTLPSLFPTLWFLMILPCPKSVRESTKPLSVHKMDLSLQLAGESTKWTESTNPGSSTKTVSVYKWVSDATSYLQTTKPISVYKPDFRFAYYKTDFPLQIPFLSLTRRLSTETVIAYK
jgi:hypothetical protein